MRAGLILDNCPIGNAVPDSTFAKLAAMRASVIGTLWTDGTHHTSAVYQRYEYMTYKPYYILRVGGHKQTADEWLSWARAALSEIPDHVLVEGRVLLAVGNEPNLEGWQDDPQGYGLVFQELESKHLSVPIAFAAPSFGIPNAFQYLNTALTGIRPDHIVANLYSHNIELATNIKSLCNHLHIGEINTLDMSNRPAWLNHAFRDLSRAEAESVLIFIAGGQSNGAWDERYIISLDEAEQLKGVIIEMEWKQAFAKYAEDHPEVGFPITDLIYDNQGNAWQYSERGLLVSAKGLGWQIFWLPNAQYPNA